MMRCAYVEILDRGERGEELSRDEIRYLLNPQSAKERQGLYEAADRVREREIGSEVHLRAIIEFSNYCERNCLYCGLRQKNQGISRYRMSAQEILQTSIQAREQGFETIVLQSGEDPWFTKERLAALIWQVKRETQMIITLSVGERSGPDYALWRDAGADRYLLKYETSSEELFKYLRPGCELSNRLKCLGQLRNLEYEVGSGNIVGLPGQTLDDLAADVVLFREYDFDMIGIGPFIPHPATPLGSSPSGSLELTLNVIAVTRIVTRNTNLPATTAASILDQDGRRKCLLSGANIIMADLTPLKYRRYYEIYPGKGQAGEERTEILSLISSIGRIPGQGPGSRKNNIEKRKNLSEASPASSV